MKKRLFLIVILVLSLVLFVGCGGTKDNGTAKTIADYTIDGVKTELEEGYISLDGKHVNDPIDKDGNYNIAGKTFKTANVLKTVYSTEPTKDKFNYLCNTWKYNSEHYTNMIDGLVENDKYSNLVGALAKGYKVDENADGTETWTFQLKKGVAWITNKTGEFYAEVTAEDFVTSIRYVLDPQNASALAGIVMGSINGSEKYYEAYTAYLNDETQPKPDFDEMVGVKAVDKYHVAYTLYEPTPYFLSSLTYSPYLPTNAKFLEEEGSDFGINENHILVNGAFRITEHETNSKMVYTRNEKYYDASHVYVEKVIKTFFDQKVATPTTLREWFEQGIIDSFSVRPTDEEGYAKYVAGADGKGSIKNPAHEECNGILGVGDATFIGYFNFVRTTYEYPNGNAKSDAAKAATAKALQNKNFRKGVLYGMDVIQNLLFYNDKEPAQWLMRGYTNRELVELNGKDYADYVDEVFNEKQGTTGVTLTGINNGSDPVYNKEKAQAFFAKAKEELIAEGLTEADFPIQLDVIGAMDVNVKAFEDAMYKTLDEAGKGVLKVYSNVPQSDTQNSEWGSITNNYDLSLWSGWSADYADPKSFLHTFVIDGDMVEQLGFVDETSHELQEKLLGEYTKLYEAAAKITDATKLDERYKKFAEAEYALIYEEALIIPWLSQNGYSASVARTVPYQAGRASYGLTGDKLKNVVVTQTIISKDMRAAVVDDYNENKGK